MIAPLFNAKEGQVWRWFPVEDTGAEVELKLATTVELRDERSKDVGDTLKLSQFMAKNWFRAFKNIKDANGVDIPNTEQNRVVLLSQVPRLFMFVDRKVMDMEAWVEEGKKGRGSAS